MTDEERGAMERRIAEYSADHGIRGLQIAWHADYVSAAQIGWRIADLDRAVRRTTAQAQRLDMAKIPVPAEGGLAFVDAAPGSAEFLFEVFGFARQILDADAVQVLLAAIALTGPIRRAWGWIFRNRDPLHGVSGRQVLEIVRELSEANSAPDGAVPIGRDPGGARHGSMRITVLVEHEDDTRTVVITEMDR